MRGQGREALARLVNLGYHFKLGYLINHPNLLAYHSNLGNILKLVYLINPLN